MAANNKSIDEAFWAGETSVKIQNGRRKYSIQFGTMMQVYIRKSSILYVLVYNYVLIRFHKM
jgi:hypothetical protein